MSVGLGLKVCAKVSFADIHGRTNIYFVDDVLVLKDGYENLTTAPKDVGEMVDIINGQKSLLERLNIL